MQTSHDAFRTFRRVMLAGIVLNVLLGLWLWWWPESFLALLSILFRGAFALFFLFASGLLWLPALYEAVLAVLQGVSFWRGWRADLMAKP
ncbi:MAG: hypothetical protein RI841_14895 [Halomonas sp.]|uniref:hypothetical protein n=1 Tax=Halomonas sp. TaxID=1486246 RepID=UPI0028707554|nr:hypothetical protein [Halomonas sp.]MDR9440765.1 hypothetical protein [Halomonas sp.]